MLLGYMLQKNFLIKIHLERKGRQKGKKERNGIGANRDSVRFFSFKFFFKERPGSLAGWPVGGQQTKAQYFRKNSSAIKGKLVPEMGQKKGGKENRLLQNPGGKKPKRERGGKQLELKPMSGTKSEPRISFKRLEAGQLPKRNISLLFCSEAKKTGFLFFFKTHATL